MKTLITAAFCAALYCSGQLAKDIQALTPEQVDACFDRIDRVREFNREQVFANCVKTSKHWNEVRK